MIPVGRDEILSHFAGKLYLAIIYKSFIPARGDPSFALPRSRFTETKFVIPCNRFRPPKKDEKVN